LPFASNTVNQGGWCKYASRAKLREVSNENGVRTSGELKKKAKKKKKEKGKRTESNLSPPDHQL
jgi:hypothetical protein